MPRCRCGARIQSGRRCRQCQLDERYGSEIATSTDGGRRVIGPNETGPGPHVQCGACGATYHGSAAARGCCGGDAA